MSHYNIDLKRSRTQSSMGRKSVEVYKESEGYSNLLLATVVAVNFVYNSVEVVTVRNNENLVKPKSTLGKYSARLPVSFGGSWANGNTYGQTNPIAIGDLVLIGFINSNLDSPVVINIYKNDVVSKELASTPKVSGNPEDGGVYREAMSVTTIFPSQTINKVWGDGNILQTFTGKSFLATTTNNVASSSLDDTDTEYMDLAGIRRPNGTIREPINDAVGKLLYVHYTKGITSDKTTSFFDDLGNYRLSRVLKDTDKRSYFEVTRNGDMYLRHRPTTFEVYDETFIDEEEISRPQSSLDSYIAIIGGVPTIYYKGFSLTIDNGELLLNGKAISTIFEEYTKDLEDIVGVLTNDVEDIVTELSKVNLEDIIKITNDLRNLTIRVSAIEGNVESVINEHNTLSGEFNTFKNVTYKNKVTEIEERVTTNTNDIGALANEIDNAVGNTFDSLGGRLNNIDARVAVNTANINIINNSRYFDNKPLSNNSVVFTFTNPYSVKPSVTIGVSDAVNKTSEPTVTIQSTVVGGVTKYVSATVDMVATSADISIQVMGVL